MLRHIQLSMIKESVTTRACGGFWVIPLNLGSTLILVIFYDMDSCALSSSSVVLGFT